MPLWESNEIYFVAGLSVLVTLGVFASLAYFVYKRAAANGRRADEEQAALEKVLLRKEAITTSPPTKPLIVSPSFSSPNKVPARHLRSGSYSPTHYLSPYHSRQPRRNSSPTSNISSIQQPKLPHLQLHHPQLQVNQREQQHLHHNNQHQTLEGTSVGDCNGIAQATVVGARASSSSSCVRLVPPTGNSGNSKNENIIKTNNNLEQGENNANGNRNNGPSSLAHHNSQYYGTIPPRRIVKRHGGSVVGPAESNLVVGPGGNSSAFLPLKCGTVIVPNLKQLQTQKCMKSEYVQLPGKDGVDFHDEGNWKNKDDSVTEKTTENGSTKWKNCSRSPPPGMEKDDGTPSSLRRKLLLQKQYQQKLQLQHQQNNMLQSQPHRLATEPPGELFKMKHTVSEEIPYYISTQ